eukprot:100940-Hanusia_phi.AAC.1
MGDWRRSLGVGGEIEEGEEGSEASVRVGFCIVLSESAGINTDQELRGEEEKAQRAGGYRGGVRSGERRGINTRGRARGRIRRRGHVTKDTLDRNVTIWGEQSRYVCLLGGSKTFFRRVSSAQVKLCKARTRVHPGHGLRSRIGRGARTLRTRAHMKNDADLSGWLGEAA